MNTNSTTSWVRFALRGAGAGLLCIGVLVAILCQGCSSERKAVAENASNHDPVGLQRKRSSHENRRLNEHYNGLQYRGYANTASR